jgi:hypothetical protein
VGNNLNAGPKFSEICTSHYKIVRTYDVRSVLMDSYGAPFSIVEFSTHGHFQNALWVFSHVIRNPDNHVILEPGMKR